MPTAEAQVQDWLAKLPHVVGLQFEEHKDNKEAVQKAFNNIGEVVAQLQSLAQADKEKTPTVVHPPPGAPGSVPGSAGKKVDTRSANEVLVDGDGASSAGLDDPDRNAEAEAADDMQVDMDIIKRHLGENIGQEALEAIQLDLQAKKRQKKG